MVLLLLLVCWCKTSFLPVDICNVAPCLLRAKREGRKFPRDSCSQALWTSLYWGPPRSLLWGSPELSAATSVSSHPLSAPLFAHSQSSMFYTQLSRLPAAGCWRSLGFAQSTGMAFLGVSEGCCPHALLMTPTCVCPIYCLDSRCAMFMESLYFKFLFSRSECWKTWTLEHHLTPSASLQQAGKHISCSCLLGSAAMPLASDHLHFLFPILFIFIYIFVFLVLWDSRLLCTPCMPWTHTKTPGLTFQPRKIGMWPHTSL